MGDDQAVLRLLSQRLTNQLDQIPMFQDVDTSLESGDEEIHVGPAGDRLVQAGLSSQAVAFTVSNTLSSRAVSHFQTGDREVDIVIQYREDERETLDQLKNVPVFTSGGPVPLGALADFDRVAGPQSIQRENNRSKVSITANVARPEMSWAAMGMVGRMMGEFPMPPGYEWSFGRWNRFQQQSLVEANFALLFALLMVYMLMASLFESFMQPLTIMFSVPFALLGVGVVMKLANQPLENMTMIGLVILLGVVVNNAIVLVDHINSLRKQGMDRDEAIITGGRTGCGRSSSRRSPRSSACFPLVAPIFFPQIFGRWRGGPAAGRRSGW